MHCMHWEKGFKKGQKHSYKECPIPERLFEIVGMDAVDPFLYTLDENRYVIVISDYFGHLIEGCKGF